MPIYLLLCAVHLLILLTDSLEFAPYTKVLLMPSLALYYYFTTKGSRLIFSILIALFFSWLGDVFLIFTNTNPIFFLLGLASFFLAHVCYIYTFVKKGSLPKLEMISILIIAGGLFNLIFLLSLLLPVLPTAMKIPVIAYGSILTTVLCATLYLRTQLKEEWKILVLGVVLFIISDSLIAFNRFLPEVINFLPNISFWIMLTYVVAQGLIIKSLTQVSK